MTLKWAISRVFMHINDLNKLSMGPMPQIIGTPSRNALLQSYFLFIVGILGRCPKITLACRDSMHSLQEIRI